MNISTFLFLTWMGRLGRASARRNILMGSIWGHRHSMHGRVTPLNDGEGLVIILYVRRVDFDLDRYDTRISR